MCLLSHELLCHRQESWRKWNVCGEGPSIHQLVDSWGKFGKTHWGYFSKQYLIPTTANSSDKDQSSMSTLHQLCSLGLLLKSRDYNHSLICHHKSPQSPDSKSRDCHRCWGHQMTCFWVQGHSHCTPITAGRVCKLLCWRNLLTWPAPGPGLMCDLVYDCNV